MEGGPTLAASPGRTRLRGWVRRYLPAEAVGTSAALVAASWAEAVAFYAFVTGRELRVAPHGPARLVRVVRGVVAEFGVAEVADTVFLRPLLMYAFVDPLGALVPGVIVGKLTADVLFYGLAIPAYELRERGRR